MKNIIFTCCFIVAFMSTSFAQQNDIDNYLIVTNIGDYEADTAHKIKGNAGILISTGHFFRDHVDATYETGYYNFNLKLGVSIQVTQHPGSDSDKWLLHEVDIEFRNYYGIPSYYLKTINGNLLYVHGAGGRDYRWISGNKVIMIEYHDSQLTKPEPLEVIQAYLAKHPSTLPSITMKELGSTANKTIWIKDEMERRLWLCDKWFMQLQLGKAEIKDVLQNTVNSMTVFLDYREKYFGIKAQDEKNLLAGYLSQNNGTAIKNKLTEYKNWWAENKTKGISL